VSAFSPGTRIDSRYQVAGRPLVGGMGIVYLCLDAATGEPVVLKTWRPEFLADRSARDAFLREGTNWIQLGAHPHIVRCHRVVRVDPDVFLVLELVAKEQGRRDASLRSLLTGSPLPLQTALLFTLQVARGMSHAAATLPGFVHLDLKPENLLIGADHLSQAPTNRLRITDFGLARALQRDTTGRTRASPESVVPSFHSIRSAGFAGTPEYAAPEQFAAGKLDLRADVYALGCILVEMLTGRAPVRISRQESRLHECEKQHRKGQALAEARGLPKTLQPILQRCLSVDPAGRYASWTALESALCEACAAFTGRAAPAPEPTAAIVGRERVATGWSYSEIGYSYLDLGRSVDAIPYFERALAAGRAEGSRDLEAAALVHLGQAHLDLHDTPRALELCDQSLAIARRTGSRRGEAIVLTTLGNAYLSVGNAQRAATLFAEAFTIHHELGDRLAEGLDLGDAARACTALGDTRRAISYYEQALASARALADRRSEGVNLNNLGNACSQLGDHRRALGLYQQALTIARQIGARSAEGDYLSNLGTACDETSDPRRALEYHMQALAIRREAGDRHGEAEDLFNVGGDFGRMRNPDQAFRYLGQAWILFKELGDRRGQAKSGLLLSSLYKMRGDLLHAAQILQLSVDYYREVNDPRAEEYASDLDEMHARIFANPSDFIL